MGWEDDPEYTASRRPGSATLGGPDIPSGWDIDPDYATPGDPIPRDEPPLVVEGYESDYGAGAVSGLRNTATGLGYMADIANQYALQPAFEAGYEAIYGPRTPPAESYQPRMLGDDIASLFDPYLPEPGWKPVTTGEAVSAVGGEVGAGILPALLTGGASVGAQLFSQGLRAAAVRGAEKFARKKMARLVASNAAGSGAGQYAERNLDPESGFAQMGFPILASIAADPLTGAAMSMRGRREARAAARGALPKVSDKVPTKIGARLSRFFTDRLASGELRVHDLIEARDRVWEMILGRRSPITDIEIQRARQSGDITGADRLAAQKKTQDEILAALAEAGEARSRGEVLPTTPGWLGGADIESEHLLSLGRGVSTRNSSYARRAADTNTAARQQYSDQAMSMVPDGADGRSSSINAAFNESRAARYAEAGDPFDSGDIAEILDRTPPIRTSDTKRVINNMLRDTGMSDVAIKQVGVDEIVARLDSFAENGRVSAANFRDVVRELNEELASKADLPKDVARRRRRVYERMRKQLEDRFSPEDRVFYDEAMEDYADFKRTFDPQMTRGEKIKADPVRIRESKVAQALGDLGKMDDSAEAIGVVKRLVSIPGTPAEVAGQVRKALGDDPARIAEVDRQLWRALLGAVEDVKTTAKKLETSGRANEGLIDLEDEGRLLALYREIAGPEKANKVQELVTRGRQARFDDSGTSGKVFKTDSGRLAAVPAAGEWQKGAYNFLWSTLRAISKDASDDVISEIAQEALLDPVLGHQLLSIPTGEVFKEWRDKIARRSARNTARETAKGMESPDTE